MNPLTLRFPPALEREFLEDYFRQSLRPLRIALVLAAVLVSLFGVLDAWLFPEVLARMSLIRFGVVCPSLLGLLALTFSRRRFTPRTMQRAIAWSTLVGGLGIVGLIVAVPPPGGHDYYAGLILAIIFYFTFLRLQFVHAVLVSGTVVLAYAIATSWLAPLPTPALLRNAFFLVSATLITMFAGYFMERYIRTGFLQARAIESERRRSEGLLRNILPASVADRLKDSPETIAESFPDVTVLFADLTDFTRICEESSPGELVHLLTEVFSRFDGLAERHGVLKVKTMGDAYMVAAGVPLPKPDHAQALAEMALAMREELARLSTMRQEPLQARIGMHTGPVVAGVIGTKRFSYDLWGDTVNTASRMESHGPAGEIQVSRETYERLREGYVFEERGLIEIKGKGRISTYLLLGRKAAAQDSRNGGGTAARDAAGPGATQGGPSSAEAAPNRTVEGEGAGSRA